MTWGLSARTGSSSSSSTSSVLERQATILSLVLATLGPPRFGVGRVSRRSAGCLSSHLMLARESATAPVPPTDDRSLRCCPSSAFSSAPASESSISQHLPLAVSPSSSQPQSNIPFAAINRRKPPLVSASVGECWCGDCPAALVLGHGPSFAVKQLELAVFTAVLFLNCLLPSASLLFPHGLGWRQSNCPGRHGSSDTRHLVDPAQASSLCSALSLLGKVFGLVLLDGAPCCSPAAPHLPSGSPLAARAATT
jgi:hypothetical protein